MREITDETIKRKHKEFNKRVKAALDEVHGVGGNGFPTNLKQRMQSAMAKIMGRS